MAAIGRVSCILAFVILQIILCESAPFNETRQRLPVKTKPDINEVVPTKAHVRVIPKKEGPLRLALKNDERCKEDIADYCSKEAKSGGNYDTLVCLQNLVKEDDLSEECHQAVWEYKGKVVNDPNFEQPAKMLCQDDLNKIEDCKNLEAGKNDIVPCLVENIDHITNTRCKHVVTKLGQILFEDYKLLKHFYKDCEGDVAKFECGRVGPKEDDEMHTQGATLECLEDNEGNLSAICRHRVMRAAELQSEDYHLNRPLYYACRDDRERLCPGVQSGKGKVYNCLMKKKFDSRMSAQCREKLTKKQKVEQKDYKANFPFLDSCRQAIVRYECKPAGDSPSQLAKVLLCLEQAMNEGNKIDGTCQAHMKELQEQLMEDYSINPAIVAHCHREIKTYCGKVEKGGKTLDCLMEKAMDMDNPNKSDGDPRFSKECYKAVSDLLKETGAGGDFKIDATLRETCRLSAQHLCQSSKTDVASLSCLFENLHHKDMAIDCQEQLMHLQFFLARDFELDKALMKVCKADAERLCAHAGPEKDTTPPGMILACLYRHSLPSKYAKAGDRLSKSCAAEVTRTMHRRASDVKLLPQIQNACIADLATHCTNKGEPGEEIKCLQDNYDELNEKCRTAIDEFTEEEGEDIDLDKSLIKHCTESAKEFCKEIMENNDADGVLPCLYRHKYEKNMDVKCRAELDHRQLIELKDYRFSSKFKEACMQDAQSNCKDKKTKPEVIECLSGYVRGAVVGEKDHVISQVCRSQLRVEKLRQAENIKFDPKLYKGCTEDVKKLCAHHHKNGPAAVLECLKDKQDQLSDECKRNIFKREEEEAKDAELDVRLFKVCKTMIKKFCSDVQPSGVLQCLKKHRREMDTDEKCRDMVFVRQKIALKDLNLNPEMFKACKKDLGKYCSPITNNDQAIPCLRKHIQKLSEQCEEYVAELEEEAALDYRLNPALAEACEKEIGKLCHDKDPGHGEIMECLKEHFKQIKEQPCKEAVRETIVKERTDIMADPILHEACSTMVMKHCEEIHHGRGKVLECLLTALDDGKIRQKQCRNVLRSRREMWSFMQISAPESLSDLASAVSSSPHRNYFFVVFTCVLAVIFIGGIVSGRFSKRVARDVKNR